MNQLLSDKRTIFWLVAPGFIFFVALVFVPIAFSVYYGFTNWDGYGTYHFIGFQNFSQILTGDPIFWHALLDAILLGFITVLIQHPLAIFIAMMVQRCGRFEKPLRTVIFIPSIISTFVTSQMWVSVFSTQFGLLNRVLTDIGLGSWTQDWLGDPTLAIGCIIFVVMWQGFGYAFLLYYSGIKGIPEELHEAALLDGANERNYVWHVMLPLLTPVIRISVVLAIVAGFKQFETVYLMTRGGPANSTQFLAMYLYDKAFQQSLFGYGNAISVLFVIICMGVTLFLNRFIRRDVGEF
ncbi:MAG: sugar ABC transporter permease [Alicyclobacillus sp.]|nr:sugar ABC transporter permease [Alicyclobacillus sp.]